MLNSLFIGQTVEVIHTALASAGARSGIVAVLGRPRISRAMEAHGYHVLTLSQKPKSLKRSKGARLYGRFDALPLEQGHLAGLVAFEISQRDNWSHLLSEWSSSVRNRGAIVLVDKASPSELTRRALCGGLKDIEQRQLGRMFVTSGIVCHVHS